MKLKWGKKERHMETNASRSEQQPMPYTITRRSKCLSQKKNRTSEKLTEAIEKNVCVLINTKVPLLELARYDSCCIPASLRAVLATLMVIHHWVKAKIVNLLNNTCSNCLSFEITLDFLCTKLQYFRSIQITDHHTSQYDITGSHRAICHVINPSMLAFLQCTHL
jgi:hypothetical protein